MILTFLHPHRSQSVNEKDAGLLTVNTYLCGVSQIGGFISDRAGAVIRYGWFSHGHGILIIRVGYAGWAGPWGWPEIHGLHFSTGNSGPEITT